MESVKALRVSLRLNQIAKRLAAHEPRPKIAREMNIRPDVLTQVLHSDQLITLLEPLDPAIASELREEREMNEISDADELIGNAHVEAARVLVAQMKGAEKDSDRRAAAIAIIELARKADASKKDTSTKKHSFPASQLDKLAEAAKEMDIQNDDAESSFVDPVCVGD